ncbi:uncharacterized protein DSM5745_06326 [Aspergillus mulundensis]|uniref:Uncharacterized protein n=1 Tax=Aspergillus mulundensis TaxID=1810919 RepID=A0A3D8RR40_9EURO|nr:hypothetical protein DSM5745_06326 [Aspergillus mulundensis]RDW76334.1 hypothetical protein DSM5745_06326 [Aspergillus mulundensis]
MSPTIAKKHTPFWIPVWLQQTRLCHPDGQPTYALRILFYVQTGSWALLFFAIAVCLCFWFFRAWPLIDRKYCPKIIECSDPCVIEADPDIAGIGVNHSLLETLKRLLTPRTFNIDAHCSVYANDMQHLHLRSVFEPRPDQLYIWDPRHHVLGRGRHGRDISLARRAEPSSCDYCSAAAHYHALADAHSRVLDGQIAWYIHSAASTADLVHLQHSGPCCQPAQPIFKAGRVFAHHISMAQDASMGVWAISSFCLFEDPVFPTMPQGLDTLQNFDAFEQSLARRGSGP